MFRTMINVTAPVIALVVLACAGTGAAVAQSNGSQSAGVKTLDRFTELSAPRRLKFISFDTPRAYPELPYYARMAVIGGKWPYTFEFVKAPVGAQISRKRGEVLWTAGKTGVVHFEVRTTDSSGRSATRKWTVKVAKKDFRFVSPEGNNADDGSISKPWKTVQHAFNRTGGSGTIYLRGGVYQERSRHQGAPGGYDKFVLMTGTGGYDFGPQQTLTHDNPLHILSYPGEHAIIEPASEGLTSICLWKSHIIFENIEVRGVAQNVLRLSHNAVVRGCDIHNVRGVRSNCQAIFVAAGNSPEVVVQDCHLHDIRQPPMPTHASGMTLYGVEDGLFEDNHIHDIDSGGINDKDGGRGNTYRGNYIHDVGRMGLMFMGQKNHWDCVAHDNIIGVMPKTFPAFRIGLHNNHVFRIRVHHNTALGPFSTVRAEETVVWNNVFQANKQIVVSAGDDTPGFMMRRCAVWSPTPKAFKWGKFWNTPGLSVDDFAKASSGAKDVLFAKVELANPAKGDFRIKETEALTQLAGKDDYLGAHANVLEWVAGGASIRSFADSSKRLLESNTTSFALRNRVSIGSRVSVRR